MRIYPVEKALLFNNSVELLYYVKEGETVS